MPEFRIRHITQYLYDRPVKESISTLRIFPIADAVQSTLQYELEITGDPELYVYEDYFGNKVGEFSVLEPHTALTIDSRMVVSTMERDGSIQLPEVKLTDLQPIVANDILLLRLADPERIKEQWVIDHMLQSLAFDGPQLLEMVWKCSEFIYVNFSYVKGITRVETTIDEILDHRSGVCQDFAHVVLQMLRTLGIPSRYVSGYVCPNRSGLRGEGATHAWVEYFHPGAGWIGIDPTNNVWVNGYHVKLATGINFNDCTPVKGTFKGLAQQSLSVYVSVGYEDGHVFEDVNEVKMELMKRDELEPWQYDWMQAQQQQ